MCVCGDFNAVRYVKERISVRTSHNSLDHVNFDRFIDENDLVDLPLCGRIFTWYKGGGKSMSRLDRFLLNDEWCLVWPNCMQVAQMRGLYDHFPLLMSIDEDNWGPRPARMLKCWQKFPGYKEFVREKWKSYNIAGWGGFILKEKLKLIKVVLKEWHITHSQNLPGKIETLKLRLSELDNKGEEAVLLDDEVEEMHGITSDIQSLSRIHTSICWQQSQLQWMREGDANSKYFHFILSSRKQKNAISMIFVEGVAVEGVHHIR